MRWIAAAVLLLSASEASADELIGARVRAWFAETNGTLSSDSSGSQGSDVSVSNDLGIGNTETAWELQAYLRIPVVGRFYLGWWWIDLAGEETLNSTITFAGETFNASTEVRSEMRLDTVYLTYEFSLPLIPLGDLISLEVGFEVGLRGFRGEGTISSNGVSGSDSGTIGLPVLGLHGSLSLFGWLRTELEIVGLSASYSNYSVSYLEASGEIVVNPFLGFFAGLGYKWVSLRFDSDQSNNFNADVTIDGLYVTAGWRF